MLNNVGDGDIFLFLLIFFGKQKNEDDKTRTGRSITYVNKLKMKLKFDTQSEWKLMKDSCRRIFHAKLYKDVAVKSRQQSRSRFKLASESQV